MALAEFIEALFKYQRKGLFKLKLAKTALNLLKKNGKMHFSELLKEERERHGDFNERLLRKVLRCLRDVRLIRLTKDKSYCYELNDAFYDFLVNTAKQFVVEFKSKKDYEL
jgi:chloramphenicol O-acetyltransferase